MDIPDTTTLARVAPEEAPEAVTSSEISRPKPLELNSSWESWFAVSIPDTALLFDGAGITGGRGVTRGPGVMIFTSPDATGIAVGCQVGSFH
jgi:hypothetical protein